MTKQNSIEVLSRPQKTDWASHLFYTKALEEYCDALQADALRYRWIMSDASNGLKVSDRARPFVYAVWAILLDEDGWHSKEELDAAIDAAMKEQA